MTKFTYDDVLLIRKTSPILEHRGKKAWVVGITEDRERFPRRQFAPGVIYTVEFEGGEAIDIHEDDLELM
jgi:hypothetical protein